MPHVGKQRGTATLDGVVHYVCHVFGARMFISIISFAVTQLLYTFATNACRTKYDYTP